MKTSRLKSNQLAIILAFASMLFLANASQAAVITVNPVADTSIDSVPAANANLYLNRGGRDTLSGTLLTFSGGTRYQLSLLRFDLSEIPADATISSAVLYLTPINGNYNYAGLDAALVFWQVVPDNSGWVEGTGTSGGETERLGVTGRYLNQTSYTSTSENSGVNWASGGAFNAATDLGASLGSLPLTSVTIGSTISINLNPAGIESWLTNGAAENAGLAFRLTTNEGLLPSDSRFSYFYSMDAAVDASLKPQLVLTYTVIPEPSSLLLLISCGMGWMLFRRSGTKKSMP